MINVGEDLLEAMVIVKIFFLLQLQVTIGILYVGVVGAFASWRWLSVACIGMCLVWGILLLMIPESPSYSLSKKNYDAAREAMQFLRGHPYIETELSEIQHSMEEAANKSFKVLFFIEVSQKM